MGPDTTTDEVLDGVDLTGTTALVTGASSGLGVETARALAAHGARLVLAVRDVPKGQRALAAVGIDPSAYDPRSLDLADLASVRAFADGVLADADRLDLLVANAGVMASPRGATADGFETQFSTNHLGHFVLVNRLVPLLVRSAPARVVVLSSAGHRIADVDLDGPGFERTPYDPWIAYGQSKTANVLFAVELDRRLRDHGVRATAVHPGEITTELGREGAHGRAARRPQDGVQDGPGRRRLVGVGRRRGRRRRRRGPLLRGLRGRRGHDRSGVHHRRLRLRPRWRPGPGVVGAERLVGERFG